jgi:hypothetical protein
MKRIPEGFSGRIYEAETFGSGISSTKWLSRARELGMNEKGYLPRAEALRLARETQECDPTNPRTQFEKDLRLEIIDRLSEKGLLDEGQEDDVKIYETVGTPLDVFHGVDAFVEVKTKDGRYYIVTMDETMRPDKLKDGAKADIVLPPPPDAIHEENEYLKAVETVAEAAIEKIEERLKETGSGHHAS